MTSVSPVLDTSSLLAHYFDEPGVSAATGAVLVHRAPHLERIPRTMVEQLVLPQKQ